SASSRSAAAYSGPASTIAIRRPALLQQSLHVPSHIRLAAPAEIGKRQGPLTSGRHAQLSREHGPDNLRNRRVPSPGRPLECLKHVVGQRDGGALHTRI